MKCRLGLPALCAILLLALPASSCGPDFPFAVFVLPNGPGGNYLAYAQGHLGILQPGYRTRSLVIAFDYITHHPLTADEQQQAVAVNKQFMDPWQTDEAAKHQAATSGFDSWIAARTSFGAVDGYAPDEHLEVNHSTVEYQYEDFANCLDDAFASASRTLSSLTGKYGRNDASVIEWTRGQDAVFSNCGDGKPPQFFGPGKPPAPPPAPHPPAVLPAGTALWLQQDRAYQIAAAHFYALDFNDALANFRAIAADPASPWSVLSRYLVARTLIREAALGDAQPRNSAGTPAQQAAAKSQFRAKLGQAQKELIAMRADRAWVRCKTTSTSCWTMSICGCSRRRRRWLWPSGCSIRTQQTLGNR